MPRSHHSLMTADWAIWGSHFPDVDTEAHRGSDHMIKLTVKRPQSPEPQASDASLGVCLHQRFRGWQRASKWEPSSSIC